MLVGAATLQSEELLEDFDLCCGGSDVPLASRDEGQGEMSVALGDCVEQSGKCQRWAWRHWLS